ncbi:conserved unknown protein [Ectocarpus siliculosus]|uniref:Rab-GAP TBC domain-containing protein n=1 Tax=Ectocarpus siliculosus TaxID=2880 RepID=D7FWI0_ECTSI|nr:conserved unknown protein [Ectocarpus siliculosus]|eukprot:CBJ32068.1 conserved unknown protein [Ectocarpus siliculosus]
MPAVCMSGEWNDDNSRGLLWRLLLGVIPRDSPPSEWATEMANKRGEYRRLKAEHRVDISKVLDTTDPMSANPLFSGSGSGDDPWSHFYERKEMTDTIKADLERLFPTGCGDHFLAPARQELLLSVLSVWADLNTETAYRQLYGMKWARLMFGREFRVEGVLVLWDHIFASSWIEGQPDVPECIENVAVAMVVSIRHQLLAEDCTGCLQLLMRYPPDQGVSTAISLSLSLAKGQSLAAFERSTEPSSFAAASSGRAAPSSSSEIQQEPAPVWLNRGGRDHGSVSGRSPSATGSAGHAPSEWRRDDGGGGGVGGAGAGGRARAFGRDERLETEREAKNNWQQGLDEFTRRAMSAAQGVAKLAVQTVERTQGGGDPRHLRTAGGVPASEALSLSRRLRTACAKMETGEAPVSLAAQEIKEVARILEARSGAPSVREPLRSTNSMGGGGGGQGVTRAFSTYSEDDGCADALYTQDL